MRALAFGLVLALCGVFAPPPAYAQVMYNVVVGSCPGITYPAAGKTVPVYIDTTGNKCGTGTTGLPTGAATSAKQDTGNTSLGTIATNTTGVATAANQATANTSLSTIATNTTGAATAANQTTANTSLSTIATNTTGASTAANQTSANTKLDTLHTDLTTAPGYSAAVSLTRTNDTNAYTANDVVGAATGSTAALTFASMGPSAHEVMITSVALEIDATAVISGETSYRLYLYNVTPPSALGDNAAWDLGSGDRASYLGYVDLGTPVDIGSTLYVQADSINRQIKLSGTSLFGYLVTNGAYTPTASRVYVITLHAVAL